MTNKPRIEPELNPAYSKPLAFHLLGDGCYFACDLVEDNPDMVWIKVDAMTAVATDPGSGHLIKVRPGTMVYPLKDQRGPAPINPKPAAGVDPSLVERMIGAPNLQIILLALNLFELCHKSGSPAAIESLKVIWPEQTIDDVRRLRMQLER